MSSLLFLIIQGLFLLKITEGAQKCYFGDFVDGKVKECRESNWKCATLTCPGTVFRGCLSPNGVCDDLVNLFTSCRDSPHQCFLCEGDICNDNSTDTTNKKYEATSENSLNKNNITQNDLSNNNEDLTNQNTTSADILQSNQGNPDENQINQNATAEMLKSNNNGNNTVNGSRGNKNKYFIIIILFLIPLFIFLI